jgi:hypothetical protein
MRPEAKVLPKIVRAYGRLRWSCRVDLARFPQTRWVIGISGLILHVDPRK